MEKIMTNRAVLIEEIKTLPSDYLGEVIDFVTWLKHRKFQTDNVFPPLTMLMSEKSLSKDWDTPEEDEAWANL